MRRPNFFLVCLLCWLVGAVPAVAQGASAVPEPVIQARAGIHKDFERIVFDWPKKIAYRLKHEGEQASLQFSTSGQVKFDSEFPKLKRGRNFSFENKDGQLIVSFTVNADAMLNHFMSDKSVVVDILGPALPAAKNEKPAVVAEKKPEPKPPMEAKPAAEQKSEPKAEQKAATEPAPKLEPVIAAAPIVPPQPIPVPETPKEVTPATASAPVASPGPAAPMGILAVPAQPAAPPPPPATPAAAPITPVAALKPVPAIELGDTPVLVATLDPHVLTRAAIFKRAGYAYVVFDRKFSLALDALTGGEAPRVPFEVLNVAKATAYRFPIPSDAVLRTNREETAWKIYLAKQEPELPVSTTLVAQPDFALGARFLLPLPDAPEPVRLNDPVVGDQLVTVPLEQTEAFSVYRRMADFEILPAAQGLIVKPLTDKVIVRSVSDGIEITGEGGLRLSRALDTGASQQSKQKAKAIAAGKSMFDFAMWKGKAGETFTQTRQRLQQTVVDVPESERNRARLELARFYFANGNGEEATALLLYLAKQVPDLTAHSDFLALLGCSRIISYRPDEGLKNLDTPLLANQPEVDLWEAVGLAELRKWKEAEEKFSTTESMLVGYPEPFYSRFSILAIESALAVGKDVQATDWLDRFEASPHRDIFDPAIAYLRGVLHAKGGRAAAAEQAWKDVARSNDRLYRVRAELALIDLGVSNNSLTASQAADRLESLRFGWRGDDLEVDILHRLGQFYVQARNIKAGLNTLSKVTQLYPNSPLTPKIKTEMTQNFHDVFLGDAGKDLSPLDALTLYQEYRGLMPTGDDGITVTKNLAERLVAIDLLDQAARLLTDLVKNKLSGEEKGKAGARLAAIRLLDHRPNDAIEALNFSEGSYSANLQDERLLLRAKALSEQHKDDEALQLLNNNNNEAAKLLRADITMHAEHWGDAAKALLDLIGKPPENGESLTSRQADWLINAGIALSLAGDTAALDKLATDYGPSIAKLPQNDTFRVLTDTDKADQLKDIAAAQSRIADVNMFQSFLEGYRKAEAPSVEEKKTP